MARDVYLVGASLLQPQKPPDNINNVYEAAPSHEANQSFFFVKGRPFDLLYIIYERP